MRKVFGMIALLLALAACNKAETDIPTEKPEAGATGKADGITITATLAPKSFGTKAVSEGTNTIVSTWAQNEKIAVLYEVNEKKYAAEANVDEVDGETGAASISFIVESGTADNTSCTLVYPASAAKEDHTGVKDAATLLAAQDGTLNASLDVRVGAGTIKTATPGLDVTIQPEPQFAIFKFTTKNADGSATIDVKPLTVIIGAQNFVITPASATSTLYAALPTISSTAVGFYATGSDSKTYEAAYSDISFTAGNFYQTVLKMTGHATGHPLSVSAVGEVVGTDGLAYAVADKDNLPLGVTAAGMVAYKSGGEVMVLALEDEGSTMEWETAMGANGAAAHTPTVAGHTWRMPSNTEWRKMLEANGGNDNNPSGLRNALENAGGSTLITDDYWTSTPNGMDSNYSYKIYFGNDFVSVSGQAPRTSMNKVRACFVFGPALISGVFSVSAGQTVKFARGNLTYISKSYTSNGWALANNSWEYSNTNYGKGVGSHHFSWDDVFKSDNSEKIKNDLGSNSWRALSKDEWSYLLVSRTVSWHRYAKIKDAAVGSGNKRYLLLFPDSFKETEWTPAMGTKPSSRAFDGAEEQSIAYTEQNFAFMQAAGIVILPASGQYYNQNWHYVGVSGHYWSCSSGSNNDAYYMYFDDDEVRTDYQRTKDGTWCFPVRLVQNQ